MKKNRNKILLLFALSAAIIGGILFFYVYKGHRDISSEEASFTISVDELHKQFQTNDSLANASYADQTILVSGLVTSFDPDKKALIVDEKLFLTFNSNEVLNLQSNQTVKIKGRFVGYDDLMEELKMDQCQLIE
ncbi:hypothetical protein [Flavobacterium sp.]|jgi:hypothetical protein|uniref:OB-fold protein n=1 Tax=Flavobacterium sp. TaxID=239 RepID=UPI0037BE9ACA